MQIHCVKQVPPDREGWCIRDQSSSQPLATSPPPKFLPKQLKSSFEAAPKFPQLFHQRWNSSQVWRGAWFGRKFETGRAQRPRVPRFSPLTRQIWHAQLRHSCLCGVCGGFKGRITARPSRENCSAWTVAENKRAKRNHSPFPTPPFSLLLFYSRAIDARLFFATGKILRGNNRPRFRAFVAGNWFISAFLRVSPSSFYFKRLV